MPKIIHFALKNKPQTLKVNSTTLQKRSPLNMKMKDKSQKCNVHERLARLFSGENKKGYKKT